MIERKIVKDKLNEFMIEEFISSTLERVGHSHTVVQKTPLGEKITIHAARPGLIVGSKGSNIKRVTRAIKTHFDLENPQLEIEEIKDQETNAALVAEHIASSMERFGSGGFKGTGYRAMENAIRGGALGIEILISGKVPSSRSRTWRFYLGYLKKCGDIAHSGVHTAYRIARLKSGVVGIQVRIMPKDLVLPDRVQLTSDLVAEEEVREQKPEEAKKVEKESAKATEKSGKEAQKPAKKAAKKSAEKPAEKVSEKADQKADPKADEEKKADQPPSPAVPEEKNPAEESATESTEESAEKAAKENK